MARVKGIITAGLSAGAAGLPTSLEADSPPVGARPVETDHVPLLEQIRGRSQRIQDAQSTAPNAELAAASGLAGLGAAAVFGPAGLLVGGIVHMLGRRRLQNMRELATQDAEATSAAVERARSSLLAAREGAETDEERAEVDMHLDRFEQLEALTLHPDANVRSSALVSMLDVTGQLDTELEEVEKLRIEAEQRDRDRYEWEVARVDDVRGELISEVGKDFLQRIDAYRAMLSVEDDSSMGDQTLIIRAMKVNDPGSAVLPGEAATAQNAAGVPELLITMYNHLLRGGERLSPTQRADIIRQAGNIVRGNMSTVIDWNTNAAERLRDQGVREELIGSSLIPLPDETKLPLPRGSTMLGESDLRALEGPISAAPAEGATLDDSPQASVFGPSVSDAEGIGQVSQALRDSFVVQAGPNIRDLGVLPDAIQAEVDKFPQGWPVYYDQTTGDLVRQGGITGGGLERMGLSDEARNSIRATLPPMESLEAMVESRRAREERRARAPRRGVIQRPSNAN